MATLLSLKVKSDRSGPSSEKSVKLVQSNYLTPNKLLVVIFFVSTVYITTIYICIRPSRKIFTRTCLNRDLNFFTRVNILSGEKKTTYKI
jgi:hypothetical protein